MEKKKTHPCPNGFTEYEFCTGKYACSWCLDKVFSDNNGPTGHGDICHSDADPGL